MIFKLLKTRIKNKKQMNSIELKAKELQETGSFSTQDQTELQMFIEQKNFKGAADFLMRKENQNEQEINVNYKFFAFAHEGAYALFQSVTEIYGRLDLNTQNGPSGPRPPQLVNIALPDGDFIQVPWGQVAIPNTNGEGVVQMNWDSDDNTFYINGTIKRKYESDVKKIAQVLQEKLDNNSIYKGQAIRMDLGGRLNQVRYNEPAFMSINHINSDTVVISNKTKIDLNPIIQRITKSEQCHKYGLDLKYGAILEGPYGTGKTLVAFMLAKMAIENGWTFIYLDDCRDVGRALRIAEKYTKSNNKGCVIFSEDIDQVIKGERDAEMQEILNTLDGGDTKGKPIISIFSTNHLELIDPTFLRGKRIGSIISMGPLDEETAVKFLETIAINKDGISLMNKSDVERAAKSLSGIVPAFAHEVIDASKVYMIARGDDKITAEDIENAADSYKRQIQIASCIEKDPTEHKIIKALDLVGDGFYGRL